MIVAALLCAGCQGDLGAVSVRWHVFDLSTGNSWDPRGVGQPDGSCQVTGAVTWTILRVHLVLADPTDGRPRAGSFGDFPCKQREATTSFDLPLGTFALSLAAVPGPDTQVVTPAPAIRTIKRAEVVNLDVIELGVRPLPLANPDGGGSD
jgi:hypothetical protein